MRTKFSVLILLTCLAASLVKAQTPAPTICPRIEIVGPKGIISTGDVGRFAVRVLPDISALKYEWTVSDGTIEAGPESTPSIDVRVPSRAQIGSIAVMVKISGLPPGCPSEASIIAPWAPTGVDPILLDEYGSIRFRDELARLDIAALELRKRPGFSLVVIIGVTTREPSPSKRVRKERIRRHLIVARKIPAHRIVFVTTKQDLRSTKFYLVPQETVESLKQAFDPGPK